MASMHLETVGEFLLHQFAQSLQAYVNMVFPCLVAWEYQRNRGDVALLSCILSDGH